MNTSFIFENELYHFKDNRLSIHPNLFIGEFLSLKEAKEYLEGIRISAELVEDLKTTNTISDNEIILALNESGEVRVTETVVADFRKLIEEKRFFPSDTLLHFRLKEEHIPGKIEYIMRDGSSVSIDIENNFFINSIIDPKESHNTLLHMTESAGKFMETYNDWLKDN